MRWVLRQDYKFKHAKTGELLDRHHYHVGITLGLFNECSSDINKAKTFRTKTLAEVYARNKGISRFKPHRVEADADTARPA